MHNMELISTRASYRVAVLYGAEYFCPGGICSEYERDADYCIQQSRLLDNALGTDLRFIEFCFCIVVRVLFSRRSALADYPGGTQKHELLNLLFPAQGDHVFSTENVCRKERCVVLIVARCQMENY